MELLARIKQKDEDLCQFKAVLTFVKLLSLLPLVCEILKLNTRAGAGEDEKFDGVWPWTRVALDSICHGNECELLWLSSTFKKFFNFR